ncbi:MAG: sulfate reduction electron transfer complex DsrMKJOP subunit DsrM [Polyangiaceae bacterium]|nr:sulfate reduction electron transfer complex DsrMKJOP subunit DsrM [Polyangiaceae bacterium]
MLARVPNRRLTLHLGGALAAVAMVCAAAALAPVLLGTRWPLLLLLVPAVGLVGFVAGFVYKLGRWIRAPVPFRIPLTAGQQRALGTFPRSRVGNPRWAWEVILRVLVDVVLFRPLLRATPSAPLCGPRLRDSARWLWLFAAVFHLSLAIVLLRHLRLLLTPVPGFVVLLERFDFLSEVTLPKIHLTTVALPLALLFLLGRRLLVPRLRYISLAADYFPLLLLLAIATTGILMRHFSGADAASIKEFTVSLATLTPAWPARPDALLLVHLFLVTLLFTYFPLSKLMHLPGALLSPTLTLANNNREVRHVNVCNPRVEVLHYADYEAAFREHMIEAGLPVEEN